MEDPKGPVAIGDWVAMYNPMWRGNRPLPRPCQVVSIGARVKVCPLDRDGVLSNRYHLLRFDEVLARFTDREEGITHCAAALALWEEQTAIIKDIETTRDNVVLQTLRGTP